MSHKLQLPPRHLWLSQRGANNQTGECDSLAAAVERKIAADAARLMQKWSRSK